MHLVFLIHGLFGNSSHLKHLAQKIEEQTDSKTTTVYSAKSISALSTFDGIKVNSRRLYKELITQIDNVKATKLSIIGYSMGGLCGRYIIGMLYENKVFNKIEPSVFATFATPHLGSRFVDGSVFGYVLNAVGPFLLGPSGFDLFRMNHVISDLADPSKQYFKGLKQFPHLFLFANAVSDRTVHFWTSFICDRNPFASNKHVSLISYETAPYFVNLKESRVHQHPQTKYKEFGNKNAKYLIPIIVVTLFIILMFMTSYAWLKCLCIRVFRIVPTGRKRGNKGGQKLMSEIYEAVDKTVVDESNNAHVTKTRGSTDVEVQPAEGSGYAGLIESCKSTLSLSKDVTSNLNDLNSLNWNKYVLVLPSLNTHAQIVNRMGKSRAGDQVIEVFAKQFKQCL